MNSSSDPRRPEKEIRYKPTVSSSQGQPGDDLTPDYMNILGMIFSMCGLMMRLKCFMLSISAVVMSYLQNPQPMTPPWATAIQ
ncbi:hypothetical protein KM043_013012 [Ampulex compressa]|nr:hypothetical protein KM043_013012 [Ampulex compressa]